MNVVHLEADTRFLLHVEKHGSDNHAPFQKKKEEQFHAQWSLQCHCPAVPPSSKPYQQRLVLALYALSPMLLHISRNMTAKRSSTMQHECSSLGGSRP